MSSKSRKKTQRTVSDARAPKTRPEEGTAGEHKGSFDIPDELLHAPRKTSKLKFALMILLIIFLLVIFIVPDAFMGLTGAGRPKDAPAVEWERPGVGREVLYMGRLQQENLELQEAYPFAAPILAQLGVGERVTREDTVRLHVLATLAADAGVRVPEEHVGEYLRTLIDQYFQGDVDQYRQILAQMRTRRVDPEEVVRRTLLVHRYLQLAGYAGAVATPEEIEAAWAFDHTEVALDYVKVDVSEFEEAARSEVPPPAELEAWLAEQPESKKEAFLSPERRTAAVVLYRDPESTPAAGLLEAFPPPEDVDPLQRAQEYYNRVYFRRFARPAPPEEPGGAEAPGETGESAAVEGEEPAATASTGTGTDEPSAGAETEEGQEAAEEVAAAEQEEPATPDTPPEFLSFEEVEEICLLEAPIYHALGAWLKDARSRAEAGEDVDLAAEAERFGLDAVLLEQVSKEELGEHEALGNPTMVNAVFSTSVDDFSFSVAWTKDVMGFARTLERTERQLPPFEEIAGEVADLWVEPRAEELATEHLRRVWEGFERYEPEPDERNPYAAFFAQRTHRRASDEEFLAAAEEAGLEVRRREHLDRGLRADPQADPEDPERAFLWSRGFLLGYLEEGEVAEPMVDPEGAAYLVRVADTRPVPMEGMSPREYRAYRDQARAAAQRELVTGVDVEFLERRYGLVPLMEGLFESRVGEETEEPAAEPAEQG